MSKESAPHSFDACCCLPHPILSFQIDIFLIIFSWRSSRTLQLRYKNEVPMPQSAGSNACTHSTRCFMWYLFHPCNHDKTCKFYWSASLVLGYSWRPWFIQEHLVQHRGEPDRTKKSVWRVSSDYVAVSLRDIRIACSDMFIFLLSCSAPREYRFVTTGSDWPSLGDDDVSVRANLEKERFQINPFRRAANWILRRRRQ